MHDSEAKARGLVVVGAGSEGGVMSQCLEIYNRKTPGPFLTLEILDLHAWAVGGSISFPSG